MTMSSSLNVITSIAVSIIVNHYLPSTFIKIIVFVLLVFYLWSKYKQTYWSHRGVYSPPAHWFFGHFRDALLLRASPQHILGELHRSCKDKPVVGIYILQKPFLLLRDNEIIKRILIMDSHNFLDRHFSLKHKSDIVGTAALFSIDNPQWRYLRTKLSRGFTSGKQRKLFELMLESADNMKIYLESRVPNDMDVVLEVRGISMKYTIDVISSLSFGIRTNSFEYPEPEFYVRSRDIFRQDLARTFQLFANFFFPMLNDLMNWGFFDPHTDYYRQIFWESMNEREKSGIKRGDAIDLLLELKNEKQDSEEFTFEGDYLLAQSAAFLVAGSESSSVTMSFTLMELARYPNIQEKVREELRQKLGNEKLTYERISEMNYLQQVVNETLRLYPPAPLIDRLAAEDYKIHGTDIVIEKGTVVYAVLPGLQSDPQYHPEPTKYDPDRFSEERKHLIKSCTYMPFGEGPRNCIGVRTGILQSMVGLITILRDYEVSWNHKYKNEVSKRAIFTAPADGVHLNFKRSPIIS